MAVTNMDNDHIPVYSTKSIANSETEGIQNQDKTGTKANKQKPPPHEKKRTPDMRVRPGAQEETPFTMALFAKTEKDNFSRLGQGIVGTGNTMARDLLTSYISPTDLVARVLPSGRPPHPVWKRLNKEQQENVKKAAVDGYAKFDISLVYVLLRNVCTNLNNPTKPNIPAPTQGWGKDPTPTDITPSDDMERLRILRNAVYGHISKASIPDTEYQIHWQELKDIASRMKIHLGKDYLKELQEAEIYKMTDADVKQMMQEVNKGKDEVIKQAKKIAKGHKKEIKEIKEHLEDRVKDGNTETKEHTKNILQEESREIKHHTTETVQNQNREIKQHITEQGRKIIEHISGTVQDNKQSIEQLDRRLLEINDAMTKHTPLAPLEEDGDTMPVDLLYASVVITEDVKCPPGSTASSSQTHREVSTPADLFERDGIRAKRIFLKGKAAHGKTTYCLWLVRKWCDSKGKIGEGGEHLDQRQETMGGFDFVFLIQFRNVNPNRSSIMDMICYDLFGMDKGCHDTIRHVLSSDDYKSLIIMDGLDEWNPNEEARKNLTCKHMPNIEGLSSGVVCFFSMRPWLFPGISRMKGDKSIVLEIHGLSEYAIENVIRNVLINHYRLEKESNEFGEKYGKILNALKDNNLRSFMKIPLLAVVCVQLCYEGEDIGKSCTTFYSSMLNMLIERAHLQHESTKLMSCQTSTVTFPKIFSKMKNVMNVSSVILSLGKVAYEGLMPRQRKLVFQESELKSEIGENELKFALNVGLISHNEARSLTTRNVTVTFFHKTIQEYLAAIFCVSKNDPDALFKVLSTINIVMEWSYVIMFICGLSPNLGCTISQHVVSLADRNVKIRKYRKSNQFVIKELYESVCEWEIYGKLSVECSKVDSLFREQACWFREIFPAGMNLSKQLNFHVSDVVYSEEHHDKGQLILTSHLLTRGCFNNIKSLELGYITTMDEGIIPTSTLNIFLPKAASLVKLMFDPYIPATSLHSTYMKSLRVLHLSDFKIEETFFKKNAPLLTNLPNLQKLEFSVVEFVDWTVHNTPLLTNLPLLHTLTLSKVVFGNIILDNTPLLTDMPKLHTLNLNHIKTGNVRMKDIALLANLPNVERLDVSSFSIGTLELGNTPLLTNMPRMQTLELCDVFLSDIRFQTSPLLFNLPSLQTFHCSNITIGGKMFEISPFLTNMPNLNSLDCCQVSLCGFNLDKTSSSILRNITNLKVLTVISTTVGNIILENAHLLTDMPNLDGLCLFDVTFSKVTLVKTSKPRDVSQLDAYHTLNDTICEETSLISNMPQLGTLFLRDVYFDEIKLMNTPLMTNLQNLEKLCVSGVTIGETTLKNTPLLTHMQKLHTLELEGITIRNNMSLENAPLITNLPSLHTLKLRNVTIGNMKLTNASLIANLQMLHVLELINVFCYGLELNGNPLIINIPKLDTVTIYRLRILDSASHDPALGITAVLSGTPNLRSVDLKYILFDMKPWLSPDMLNLEEIILEDVKFSLEGWKLFIDSLTRIHHNFDVRLKNVKKDVKTYIRQSPDFAISTSRLRYRRRFSCRYIGRHVYFGRYIRIYPVHFCRYSGRFIGKTHSNTLGTALGMTHCKYGRNVDRYVVKYVNSFVVRIFYDLSIKRVWPINT
ncbi:hypothetical protein FSP39_021203 [Pinctada imbricata]|uniref:NACHT domain-containing protein n=1 Tax=Pinctada imbricata TaxID=66713 RepID=A0AA88XF34_PINIB|nr:hypothetical protein FSP39_021203 [Pinctada imbricata]